MAPKRAAPKRVAPKRKVASKAKAKPVAGPRRAPARRGAGTSGYKVAQQILGQQTENRIVLASHKPDSRARIIRAVSGLSHHVTTESFDVTVGSTGLTAWGWTAFSNQQTLQNMAYSIATQQSNGAVPAGSVGGLNQSQPIRYLLENVTATYDFINRSQAAAKMKIYFCSAKQDLYQEGMTYYSQRGISYDWDGAPITAIAQGVAAAGNLASGNSAYLNPGIVPFSSPLFTQYFRVTREMEINFAVGGTHKLILNKHYDKMLDATHYANAALRGLNGVTEYLVFQLVGQAAVQTVQSSPGPPPVYVSSVTTAPPSVSCVETLNYRYRVPPASFTTTDTSNALGQDALASQTTVISGAIGSGTTAISI